MEEELIARSRGPRRADAGPAAGPRRLPWRFLEGSTRREPVGPAHTYRALAIAVRNKERAFAFYSYIAAEARSPGVRALAEDLARDELEHAAVLRRERRRAFRRERPAWQSPAMLPR